MKGGTQYAFAALVCYGLGDFIYKRAAAAAIAPHHFLMGQGWCFAPVIFLYAWATGTLVVQPSAFWGGLAGLFLFIGFYNFLRSLAVGSVSIHAPIFRLNFVITAALAIAFLGEPLRAAMLGALVLALAAVWLLLGGLDHTKPPEVSYRSLTAVVIATVALGAARPKRCWPRKPRCSWPCRPLSRG
jgi:drug/metabolite transporter (DMT)-like permease